MRTRESWNKSYGFFMKEDKADVRTKPGIFVVWIFSVSAYLMFFMTVPVKRATDQKYPAQCIYCIDTTCDTSCAATAMSSALYLTEPKDFCVSGPLCLPVDVRQLPDSAETDTTLLITYSITSSLRETCSRHDINASTLIRFSFSVCFLSNALVGAVAKRCI